MSSAYQRALRSKRSNAPILVGLALLVGGFGAIPMLLRQADDNKNLLLQDKPLTGSQVQRGAYLNSGSVDAGPDPVRRGVTLARRHEPGTRTLRGPQDWDMSTHSYRGKSVENFDEATVRQLAPQFLEKER